MKPIIQIIILVVIIFGCNNNQQPVNEQIDIEDSLSKKTESAFDSILAKKLGADEYGMKQYVFAYLKKGPKRNHDSATVAEIQKGHLQNITRLANEGKLILAGPFMDDTDIRGIFIFNVETIEEAEVLINTDPAVKSGRLIMELHQWYGSAALVDLTRIHKKISKKNP